MKTLAILSLAAACLASGGAHAQQSGAAGGDASVFEVIDIPQPPATAYHGLRTILQMPAPARTIVVEVDPGSPAAAAGFVVGDTLDLVDGRDPVQSRLNLRQLIPGQEYGVTVRRGGETRALKLVPAVPRETAADQR
ncbi:MAG TPA: PDZ domain-containing protein [Longimicrobium sp.]|nr:PDZ domain-containing protein [Longimicrobium sp.]